MCGVCHQELRGPSTNNGLSYYEYTGDLESGKPLPNRSMSSDTSSYASPLTLGALYLAPVGIMGSHDPIFLLRFHCSRKHMDMGQYQVPLHGATRIVDLIEAIIMAVIPFTKGKLVV
ncbi:hypothetical protein Tco_1059908 [Tanacetum coccineum]